MITEDINYAINESTIDVDVIVMDMNTYKELYMETVSLIYGTNLLSKFLRRQMPDSMTILGVPIEISNKVKGFALI